jgi:hypothetical protein
MKRIVVDIDNTVANPSEREKSLNNDKLPTGIRWNLYYNADRMSRDGRIPSSSVLNHFLGHEERDVVFITTRPESTREATIEWLSKTFNNFSPEKHRVYMPKKIRKGLESVWKAELLSAICSVDEAFILLDDNEQSRAAISRNHPNCKTMDPASGGWEQLAREYNIEEEKGEIDQDETWEVDSPISDEVHEEDF